MKPHYLHLPLHLEGLGQGPVQSQKRLEWLIAGLALLALLLIGVEVIA